MGQAGRVIEDFERCYRAVQSKDTRFDGWFFTAVTSTGIYCRPSCPAMTPKGANVRFYATAAAAQLAGFRACKRCRPDAAPGSPEWETRADVVGRAMRLIADGVVDREGVPGLAGRLGLQHPPGRAPAAGRGRRRPLGLGARPAGPTRPGADRDHRTAHGRRGLRRRFRQHPPVQRLGAGHLRSEPERLAAPGTPPHRGARPPGPARPSLARRLSCACPTGPRLCPDNLFGHLAATAVPGVEEIRDGAYRRTLRLPHGPGLVSLVPAEGHIRAAVTLVDLRDLGTATARCRRLLDLDADPQAVGEALPPSPPWPACSRAPPGGGYPGRSTRRRWPYGRYWASKSRPGPPGPTPVAWPPPTGHRSTTPWAAFHGPSPMPRPWLEGLGAAGGQGPRPRPSPAPGPAR